MLPSATMRPLIDDGGVIAEALHHFKDVRGEEDRCTVMDLIEQDVFHQTRADRVNAFERKLVHEEQLRPVDERSGHGDPLAHTFGVFGNQFAALTTEFEKVEQFSGAGAGEIARQGVHAAGEFEEIRRR